VLCLSKEQLKLGHSVTVLTLNKNFADNTLLSLKDKLENINIIRLPFWGSKRYPLAFSTINYLRDYDLVHVHCVDFFVDYLVLLKPFHRKRIVLHTHGGFFHTEKYLLIKKIFFNLITRLILKGCDKIIADSSNDLIIFSKINKNIIQVDDGADVDKFNKIERKVEPGYLLYIGRIDTHKRIDNLIKTVSILVKKGLKIKLNIIGPDWKRIVPQLMELINKLDLAQYVKLLGKLSDQDLLNETSKAHIFVSASEYESFGISAVEALAAGIPCVLNNIDSFKQFLDNQDCGNITDFNNQQEAAAAIEKIINLNNDDYLRLSSNAKISAQRYAWKSVANKILSIYKETLNQ